MTSARMPDDVSQHSFGELLNNVAGDLSTLLRQEIELAKAEARVEARKAGRAGGMFAATGLAAHMMLLFVSAALWAGLSHVVDAGWAALIVAAAWAVVGAVLYGSARSAAAQLRGLPRTAETLKDIPAAVKPDSRSLR